MGGKFRESCPGIRPKSRFFPKESSQITPLPWNSGLELPVPRRIHPKSPFFPKENSQNSLDLSQAVVLLKEFPGKVRRAGRSTRIPSEAGSTWTKASIFPKNPLGGNSSPGIPRSGSSERQRLRFGKNLGKPGISGLFFWEFCELWVLRFLFCPESWEIPSGCGVFLVDIQGKGRGIPGIDVGIPGWNFGMRIRTRRGPRFSLFALVPFLFPGNFGIFFLGIRRWELLPSGTGGKPGIFIPGFRD